MPSNPSRWRSRSANIESSCNYLVIATHVPLMGIANLASAAAFQTKLASFSSYAVSATLPHVKSRPEVSLWDTSTPTTICGSTAAENPIA